MKKLISLFAAISMLSISAVAVQAEGLENYLPTDDDAYSFVYEVGADYAGEYYGMVAVAGTGENINTTNVENFVYIDQQTADSTGKISFSKFAPKGAAPSEAGYTVSTVFIGGAGLNGAQAIGILREANWTEETGPVEFIISGKVLDKVTFLKGATVTVVGTDGAVATTTVPFTADAEGAGIHSGTYSITVPASADYSVVITKDGYLTFTYTNVDVDADVALEDVDLTLLAGDLDFSGDKKIQDLNILLNDYNKQTDQATVKLSDIDGSGDVKIQDLNALLAGYNGGNITQALPEATPAN